MYLVEESIVAPGGPSAPVWAFLTAISLALIGIIAQQISAKRAASEAKVEAAKAASNSQQAVDNTTPIANGFVTGINEKLNRIQASQDELSTDFRHHLEMHLRDTSRDKGSKDYYN